VEQGLRLEPQRAVVADLIVRLDLGLSARLDPALGSESVTHVA
jgi:hypothetical protein